MITIGATHPWVNDDLLHAFARISPSTVGHMTDSDFMKGLQSLNGKKLVGRALTVKIPHMDSSAVHIAVSYLKPGDVLVVDMNGDFERACVGGVVAYAAHTRGAAGIIVDGSITDLNEIRSLEMPVYFRNVSPLTTRNLGIEGTLYGPVSIGGAVVLPDDLIFGDENGVMTLRGDKLLSLANVCYDKEQGEAITKQKLDAGELLMNLSGASKYLPETGRNNNA